MKLLNVGCGGARDQSEHWWNLDCLREQLKEGTPERRQLDSEPRYIDHDLNSAPPIPILPFTSDAAFDGILCSHVVEHFDCHGSAALLTDCRRVLKPGGLLVVSVPDAEYFMKVHSQDTPERAVELFGEPICPDEPWHKSFFDYGLFYNQHKQVLTEPALRCLFIRAGFAPESVRCNPMIRHMDVIPPEFTEIMKIMNRRKFSLEMCAVK